MARCGSLRTSCNLPVYFCPQRHNFFSRPCPALPAGHSFWYQFQDTLASMDDKRLLLFDSNNSLSPTLETPCPFAVPSAHTRVTNRAPGNKCVASCLHCNRIVRGFWRYAVVRSETEGFLFISWRVPTWLHFLFRHLMQQEHTVHLVHGMNR